MAIPTAAPWDLANFDESNLSVLLGLGPSDLSILPTVLPYFAYSPTTNLITVASVNGVLATADFNVPVPSRHTVEVTVRFRQLPDDVGDVSNHRMGLTLADDSSRGLSLYFARTGLAISRIDDFGSVAPLPGSADDIREIDTVFHTIRVAVDGSLGRAYVFVGVEGEFLPLRYIVPIEATPSGAADTFRLFIRGSATDPAQMEIKALRLGSDLIISNVPPTADAGPDRVLPVGQAARLNGRGSFDLEGAQISYLWRAFDAPFGSQFAHDNSAGSTVDDGDADGFTKTLTFGPNTLPAWVAQNDVLVIQGTRHVIDVVNNPTGSLIVKLDALSDTLTKVPFRVIRQSLLVGSDTETPFVVPDIQGLYRFELIVNDGETDSEPAEVLVSVVGARAPFGIEPQVEFLWDALGDEWRFVENRSVFQEFWRGTAQLLGGKLLEAWQHHYNFNLGDAQRVFQRKWLAYRTLIAETNPEKATISPRYGVLIAGYDFAGGDPSVTGETLVVEWADKEHPTEPGSSTLTFTADTLAQVIVDINAAMVASGVDVEAFAFGTTCLGLRSSTQAFRVLSTSTATGLLFPTDQYNYLGGSDGAMATERTYRVDAGIDLQLQGVQRGDILSINNGQAYIIDRVLSDPSDPGTGQRVLVTEPLPFDASKTWEIPSVVRSTDVDYEREGSYPGDLVKAEIFDTEDSSTADVQGTVVAQRGNQVGARLDGLFNSLLDTSRYELRLLGVKRRKALPIDPEVVSIPQLQDKIAQVAGPTIWKENIDYYLDPFYRETDGSGLPMLQFRDETFLTPDLEPPDIFWAELTLFSNEGNIENLFGRLVGFLREDAATFGEDFSYASAVAGLLYAYQRGPRVQILKTGAQILFGQPFAEVRGTVTEIRGDFSPTTGRVLVQDYDGFDPPRTEVIRSYVYSKNPLDTSNQSGLETNPATGNPYAVGDIIEQFAPIGTGVEILDYLNDPDWYYPFVRSGLFSELEKFHTYAVEFNLDLVTLVGLALAQQFLLGTKPTYTYPILLGAKNQEEDIDIVDVLNVELTMHLTDAFSGYAHDGNTTPNGLAYHYDDYRGDGTVWAAYGGGGDAFYDGILDTVSDRIDIDLVIDWQDTSASIQGTADLSLATYPGDFTGRQLDLNVDGTVHNIVFSGGVASPANVVSEINAAVGSSVASLGGQVAEGTITAVAVASLVDGETFVLDDGTNPAVTFEFDDDASVVESGTLRQVDISAITTATEVRDAIVAAINGAPTLDITAYALPTGLNDTVQLYNDGPGTVGNNTITETVTNVGFVVAGMSQGTDKLVITSTTSGVSSYVEVMDTTTAALFTVLGFNLGSVSGAGLGGTQDLSSATYPSDFAGRTLQLILDGTPYNVVFSGGVASASAVVSEINAATFPGTASLGSITRLFIISPTSGASSSVEIGAGTTTELQGVIGVTIGQKEIGGTTYALARGNVLTHNGQFVYDNLVEEGAITGGGPVFTPNGTTFYPWYGQSLAAGDYRVQVELDAGNDVIP